VKERAWKMKKSRKGAVTNKKSSNPMKFKCVKGVKAKTIVMKGR